MQVLPFDPTMTRHFAAHASSYTYNYSFIWISERKWHPRKHSIYAKPCNV